MKEAGGSGHGSVDSDSQLTRDTSPQSLATANKWKICREPHPASRRAIMLPIWPLRLPRFVSGRVPACFPLTRSETPSLRLSRLGILREEESRRSSGPAEGREGAVRDPADAARARGGGYYKQAHEEIGSTEKREGRGVGTSMCRCAHATSMLHCCRSVPCAFMQRMRQQVTE